MKDLPHPDRFNKPVPENFFENQFESILQKTTGIENWQYPGRKDVSRFFPVPEGYWMTLEDGIRNRILPQPTTFRWWRVLKQVTIGFSTLVLLLFAGYFFVNTPKPQENWRSQLDKINNEELIAYVDANISDIQDNPDLLTLNMLPTLDAKIPLPPLADDDVEEALENAHTDEILINEDIN